MKRRVFALADIANPRLNDLPREGVLGDFRWLRFNRRFGVWGGEHRLSAQFSNASLFQDSLVALATLGLLAMLRRSKQTAPFGRFRAIHLAGCSHQSGTVFGREFGEQPAIARDRLEHVDSRS
jgi:hypothetical protein